LNDEIVGGADLFGSSKRCAMASDMAIAVRISATKESVFTMEKKPPPFSAGSCQGSRGARA
jgi:hypothetical protein